MVLQVKFNIFLLYSRKIVINKNQTVTVGPAQVIFTRLFVNKIPEPYVTLTSNPNYDSISVSYLPFIKTFDFVAAL